LIPKVSKIWPALSFADLLFKSVIYTQYEAALREIDATPVNEIYVDDPSTVGMPESIPVANWPPFPRAYNNLFTQLREHLKTEFQLVGIQSGWEVWQRKLRRP
jgi:hypothetical protein